MTHVFIDGQEGTTGLEIQERLRSRTDITLVEIDPEFRKDAGARRACMARADITILCLPDKAAIEAVELGRDTHTRFIDASTAHRTHPEWVYGLPELGAAQRDRIRSATRVANPGCHATGFALVANPLVQAGLLPVSECLVVHSISGYSGGGKKLIEAYRTGNPDTLSPPRPYALGLTHKHLPEMQAVVGLQAPPLFVPVVGPFYRGMLVSLGLATSRLSRRAGIADIHAAYTAKYAGEHFIRVMPLDTAPYLEDNFLSPLGCNGTNRVDIFVFGNDQHVLAVGRLDNLGKGASGAAVQNLNLMVGAEEAAGLTV